MQFVQAPCYATMGKLSDINDIFNRRKNVFHLSEFSAKSENPNWSASNATADLNILAQVLQAGTRFFSPRELTPFYFFSTSVALVWIFFSHFFFVGLKKFLNVLALL